MGLFSKKNKRNSFEIRVLYAGRTDSFMNREVDDELIHEMAYHATDFMTEGIPVDVLGATFIAVFANTMRAGIKLNEKKMVDRNIAGIYQTILYPVDGGKIELWYDSKIRNGTANFWFDLSCVLDMTRDVFVSTILLPTIDELKEKGFHFNIKN